MNIIDSIIYLNYRLYRREGIINKLYSFPRVVVRNFANCVFPYLLNKKFSPSRKSSGDEEVIVSLTSFPDRIDKVWMVIECMKRQSHAPDKIFLWLSKDQFGNNFRLPDRLINLVGDDFQVRFVDGDMRSHKKYYYVAQEYPDSLIFLVDDDLFYPSDIIEKSLNAYRLNPQAIVCNYGYHMKYNEGHLQPYNTWKYEFHYSESRDLFFGSGGGTLLRPNLMYKDLLNKDLFLKLTPIADDVWLNAMAHMAELKIVILRNGLLLPISEPTKEKLASINKGLNKNDEQLVSVSHYYIDIFNKDPFSSAKQHTDVFCSICSK